MKDSDMRLTLQCKRLKTGTCSNLNFVDVKILNSESESAYADSRMPSHFAILAQVFT